MLIIGLTGSIASGKNFVADQFKKFAIPVFDADYQVHEIYKNNPVILKQIKKHFPKAIINQQIDREQLGKLVFDNKKQLAVLENIIHPEIKKAQHEFIQKCRHKGCKMVILNIPLLFEKGGYKQCHKNIVVTAPIIIQKQRFLKRIKMHNQHISSESAHKKLQQILANQISDSQKKKLADFIIYNGLDKAFTLQQVKKILKQLLTSSQLSS